MLDLNLIRSNPEYVKEALKKREYDVDFSELLSWDARRRALLMENESLKAERNRMSKEIPRPEKAGQGRKRTAGQAQGNGGPGQGNGRGAERPGDRI